VCGVLVVLFSVEQIVNGLRNGFAAETHHEPEAAI